MLVLEGQTRCRISAARVADEVHQGKLHRVQEPRQMLHHGAHRVIVVLGIVGVALAELIGNYHAVALGEGAPILAPGISAGTRVAGTEISAVDQNHCVAQALFVIAGAYAIYVDRSCAWKRSICHATL